MGIKNLHRFLQKHAPGVYREVSLSSYRGKTVAVDVNVYLYRFKSTYKDKWLNAFVNFICVLKRNGLTCIFVYDTKAPAEKDLRKEERRQRKKQAEQKINDIQVALDTYDRVGTIDPLLERIMEKHSTKMKKLLHSDPVTLDKQVVYREVDILSSQIINLTKHDIRLTKEILGMMGIPYYDAETEAETLCAYFCCYGKVDAVLSDDTDVLVYGTPIFITKLNVQQELVTEMTCEAILQKLDFTQEQFIDFCIMCGTDYNKNMYRIGSEKAFKLLQRYQSIEGISTNTELDTAILNHERVREIFHVPRANLDLEKYCFTNTAPNMADIQLFAFTHHIVIPHGILQAK